MKLPLLAAALLLVVPGRQAIAQRAPLAVPVVNDHPAIPIDSAAVLHRLFQVNRQYATGLGLVVSTGISVGIKGVNDAQGWRQAVGGIGLGANTGLLVLFIVDRIRFNHIREREAIEQLRQHRPLRPYVQKNYSLALLKAAAPRR